MWIAKSAYYTHQQDHLHQISTYQRQLDDREQEIATLDGRVTAEIRENKQLRERLIAAEGAKRAAQAMNDLLTLQINELRDERAQFLQKLLDPAFRPQIRVPKIEKNPELRMPSVDFEDMGDAMAAHHGQDDLLPVDPITKMPDDITGLTGRLYDPASELGGAFTGLGDDPPTPPDM